MNNPQDRALCSLYGNSLLVSNCACERLPFLRNKICSV
uniref:Uncharacterized protein n=1 Tax=Anguilla anguilla TaxID=7936 RepID=A0A0E9SC64_ANGAN